MRFPLGVCVMLSIAVAVRGYYSVWIGGSDEQEEGKFMWVDGTAVDDGYHNW